MNIIKYLYFFQMFFATANLYAQDIIFGQTASNVPDSGKLYVASDYLVFFKNNEYFHPIIEGYTLPGATIYTALGYSPVKNARIEAGVDMLTYWGNTRRMVVTPTARAVWQVHESFSITLGRILGGVHHRLPDILYGQEIDIMHRNEQGMQFVLDTRRIWADTWLNWERFIWHNDTFTELLNGGLSARFNLLAKEHFDIQLPLSVLATHRGGQIDNDTTGTMTSINGAAGLQIQSRFATSKVELLFLYAFQKDNGSIGVYQLEQGSGLFFQTSYQNRWLQLQASYWKGNNFYAYKGDSWYQSLSFPDQSVYIPQRSVVKFYGRVFRQLGKNFRFGLDAGIWYDTNLKETDFFQGLYMSFTHNFTR